MASAMVNAAGQVQVILWRFDACYTFGTLLMPIHLVTLKYTNTHNAMASQGLFFLTLHSS